MAGTGARVLVESVEAVRLANCCRATSAISVLVVLRAMTLADQHHRRWSHAGTLSCGGSRPRPRVSVFVAAA
jgi:hypothetical protein